MSEAKHTKGPWQYYYDQSDHFVHKVRVGAGLVCQMPGWRINSELQTEQEANASLIAAAPELLEALKEAKAALEWCVEQGGGPVCEHKSGGVVCFCKENAAIKSARAAIAKALGEQV